MSSLKGHLVDRTLTFWCGTEEVTGTAYASGDDAEAIFLQKTAEPRFANQQNDTASDVVVNLGNSQRYHIDPMDERATKDTRKELSLQEWLQNARGTKLKIRFLTNEIQGILRRVTKWDVYGFELVLENEAGAQEHVLWRHVQWLSAQQQTAAAATSAAAATEDGDDKGEGSGGTSKLSPLPPDQGGDIALEEPREEDSDVEEEPASV